MIQEVFCQLRPYSAAMAINFYKAAFGAVERFRLNEASTGRIAHAELQLGPTVLKLSDAYPEAGFEAHPPDQPAHFSLHLHVEDADAALTQAVQAGATLIRPAENQFYGERSGTIRDPFGYDWKISHQIELVSPKEMQRRYDAMTGA
jgi:PhnB protein